MQGLLSYLVSVDADKTANVHTDPHLVAGSPAMMAWFDDGILDQDDAKRIAAFLDRPHKEFGVEVMRRDDRKGAPIDPDGKPQLVKADVWHCSISVAEGERKITDQEWGDIANDFVDAMGFSEASGKAQCRWAAVDHGASSGGNQHIHIALSLVREDGTKASVHNDRSRAQDTCRALEKKYGLEELSTVHASRGYGPAEKQTAVRQGREMHRTSLERKVRAASTAASSEAEFVRQGRDTGLLMRPRYAKNTTDVVVGYSVAERPPKGERPVWFGGGKIARDLGLGQLRDKWPDTAQSSLDAVAEWNAAARNRRQVKPQRGPIKSEYTEAQQWSIHTAKAKEMADRLASLPVDDHASWAKVARETSGVFAAWSTQLENTAGPLAATAAELAKTAQLRDYRQHTKPVPFPSLASSTMLLLAAGSKSKTAAQSALLMQLMRTSRAIYDMHQESNRLREVRNLGRVLSTELAPFVRAMPDPVATTFAPIRTPAAESFTEQDVPESLRLLRLSSPVPPGARGGSVVPTKTEPTRTYQPTKTGPEQDYGR
uniref:relaxase/mobilization nuclease domain-containing protein n=1 Tax=Arthrobacter sp. TaxID=1667 RepID=UPI0020D22461|nr:relaxase [Arthrobacter sp.]